MMVQWSQRDDGKRGEKMNALKLKGKIIENGMSIGKFAEELGVSRSSLWRKMDSGYFTIGEAEKIVSILNLRHDDAIEIFFPDYRNNATKEI